MTVSEKQFTAEVVRFALGYGWQRWHVSDSRKVVRRKNRLIVVPDPAVAGYPDETLVHPLHGIIFAELKIHAAHSKVSEKQAKTLDLFATAALAGRKMFVHVWRPDDMDTIIRPLLETGKGPVVYGLDP